MLALLRLLRRGERTRLPAPQHHRQQQREWNQDGEGGSVEGEHEHLSRGRLASVVSSRFKSIQGGFRLMDGSLWKNRTNPNSLSAFPLQSRAMDQLQGMRVFARVAELGSFARAADLMDMSRAMASSYVAQLEKHLGTRLLHRTTRKVTVSPEGAVY